MLLWLLKYRTLGSDKSVLMTALATVYCCLWKWYGHKKKTWLRKLDSLKPVVNDLFAFYYHL